MFTIETMQLLDTSNQMDAWISGYVADSEDEAIRAELDLNYRIPTVALNGPDGEVKFHGVELIRAMRDALDEALAEAARHGITPRPIRSAWVAPATVA